MPRTTRLASTSRSKARSAEQPSIAAFARISKPTTRSTAIVVKERQSLDEDLNSRKGVAAKTRQKDESAPYVGAKRKRENREEAPVKRCKRKDEFQNEQYHDSAGHHEKVDQSPKTPPRPLYDQDALSTPVNTPEKQSPLHSAAKGLRCTPTKGQQRQADLRKLSATAHKGLLSARHLPSPPATPSSSPTTGRKSLESRNASLISRLKAKEHARNAEPAPPSADELAQRAALRRLTDIAAVLSLPRSVDFTGTRRKAHSLTSLVQSIRQSVRTPLSREDVERCLRLLADKSMAEKLGAQGFVTFVRIGDSNDEGKSAAEGVVVDSHFHPSDLEKRVEELLPRP